MTKETNNFPKTIIETMRILNDCKVPAHLQCVPQANGEGMAFVQQERCGGRGGSQGDRGDQLCWHCGKTGHLRSKYPELQELKIGVDNLNIKECDNAHALFSTKAGCDTLGQRNAKGVQGILPPKITYISIHVQATPALHTQRSWTTSRPNAKDSSGTVNLALSLYIRQGSWEPSIRCE